MKKYFLYSILTLLSCIIFASCASSSILTYKNINKKLNQYSDFRFTTISKVTQDVNDEKAQLDTLVLKNIRKLKLFNSTEYYNEGSTSDGTLIGKAVIHEINKVSTISRLCIGAFAGRASLAIKLLLIDADSGESIGEFGVLNETGGTGWAGTTYQTIQTAANLIVKLIVKYYK